MAKEYYTDFKAMINLMINVQFLKEPFGPIIEVLNRHGFYGNDAAALLFEINEACNLMNKANDDEQP